MEVLAKIVAVTFESFFKGPILHKEAKLDLLAQKCVEAFSAYGLKPTQVNVRNGDFTFDYELSIVLFNGNGRLKVNSEKAELHLQNATSQNDLEVIADSVTKVYEHLIFSDLAVTVFTAAVQATAASPEVLKDYQSQYTKLIKSGSPENEVVNFGLIAYVRCKGWAEEIRISTDRSLVFPEDGLFFTWQTTLKEKRFNRELLENLKEACNQASDKLNLVFPREKK